MARGQSAYADALNSLLNDLPSLILQYKSAQEGMAVDRERMAIQEKIGIFDSLMKISSQRAEMHKNKVDTYKDKIEEIKTEIGEAAGSIPDPGDIFSTLEGVHFAPKVTDELIGPYKDLAEAEIEIVNSYSDQTAQYEAEMNWYKDIGMNVGYLEGESVKVSPDASPVGPSHILQQDDLSAYFEDNLTGKGPGVYNPEDPLYPFYKQVFSKMAPSFEKQMAQAITQQQIDASLIEFEQTEAKKVQTAYNQYALSLGGTLETDSNKDLTGEFTETFKSQGNYENAINIIRNYNPTIKDREVLDNELMRIIGSYASVSTNAPLMLTLLEGRPMEMEVLSILYPDKWLLLDTSYQTYKANVDRASANITVKPKSKPKPSVDPVQALMNEMDEELKNE